MTDETPLATRHTHDLVKSMKEIKGQNWNVYTTAFQIGRASPKMIRIAARERGLNVPDNVQRVCNRLIELGVMEQRGEIYDEESGDGRHVAAYVIVDRLPVRRDGSEKKLPLSAKNVALLKAEWDLCIECRNAGLPMPPDEKIPTLCHVARDWGRKATSEAKTHAQNKAREAEQPKEARAPFAVTPISPESLAALPSSPPPPPPPPPTFDAPPSLATWSDPIPPSISDDDAGPFPEAEL